MLFLKAAAVAPGVIVHELGHATFCHLAGVPIRRIMLFRIGSPAGFVTHALPPLLRQQVLIAFGPLLLNSAVGCLVMIAAWRVIGARVSWWWLPLAALLSWLGLSVLVESWPSSGDARALHQVTVRHLRSGNVGAVLALPVAWLLIAANWTRRVLGHWLYAAAFAWLARGLAL